jgi:hypothetical protein
MCFPPLYISVIERNELYKVHVENAIGVPVEHWIHLRDSTTVKHFILIIPVDHQKGFSFSFEKSRWSISVIAITLKPFQ